MAVTQMYLRMKNENGSAVWRNIAPQYKSVKLSAAPATAAAKKELVSSFIPIQTEQLYVEDGVYQIKVITENIEYYNVSSEALDPNSSLPGSDAWEDTTNEKYVVALTDGQLDYGIKLPNAATAVLGTGSLETAVVRYCNAIQNNYQTGDGEQAPWTQVSLTGVKDSVVAVPE